MARKFESAFREITRLTDDERSVLQRTALEAELDDLEAAIIVAANTHQFLETSEYDDTDGTYYFYGGIESNPISAWKINRYTKSALVRTSADQVGNPSKTTLAEAWTDRLTIAYS